MQSLFQPNCGNLPYDLRIVRNESSAACSVDAGKKQLVEDPFQMLVDVSTAEYHQKHKEIKMHNDGVIDEGCSSNII
jgi:hypothetical protein